jgi:hypothetical protein
MLNQSGITGDGTRWSVTQLDDMRFQIQVGDDTDIYECQYPTLFGLDVSDVTGINIRLEEMITIPTTH